MKTRKPLPVLLATLLLSPALAWAEGSSTRGGGDLCQGRIEEIRNDIATWIAAGFAGEPMGSGRLDFAGTSVRLPDYNAKMRAVIQATRDDGQASISCTNEAREVEVQGKQKTCVAYYEEKKPRILCYRGQTQGQGTYVNGFMAGSQEEQYFQVHHELAVLAELEDRNGSETNYPFSKQVSGMLEDRVVKKLAIKAPAPAAPTPENDDAPGLARVAREIWEGMVKNRIIVPEYAQAAIGARTDYRLFEVKVKMQLGKGSLHTGDEPVEVLPMWISVAFDPLHPGNLAYSRLRGAALATGTDWKGGAASGRIGEGTLRVGLDGKTTTALSQWSFVGGEVHQVLDITSNGKVQLYLRAAASLGMSTESMRTLDVMNDDANALYLGEAGVRLMKSITLRGRTQGTYFNPYTKNSPTQLEGFAHAHGGGVDWQISKRVKATGSVLWMDTSGLDNNLGTKSVVSGRAGLEVRFW